MSPSQATQAIGENPYMELDGKSVTGEDLGSVDEKDIASVTVFTPEEAPSLYGTRAKDGAVIMETKKYAIKKFESFFKSISPKYAKVLEEYNHQEIQYILNGRVLGEDFEGNLASINSKLLKKLKILNKGELKEKYNISDKAIGIEITSKTPKNLYNAKEKF